MMTAAGLTATGQSGPTRSPARLMLLSPCPGLPAHKGPRAEVNLDLGLTTALGTAPEDELAQGAAGAAQWRRPARAPCADGRPCTARWRPWHRPTLPCPYRPK